MSIRSIPMEEVIANSFMDYHVKGFHYLCLKRTPEHTVKLYFFEGDVSNLPEVVAPHDHRYDFDTHCLAGQVENRWYSHSWHDYGDERRVYQRFDYVTPLNGGDGFKWREEDMLYCNGKHRCRAGGSYTMAYNEIHTIQLLEPGTILRLDQRRDELAIGEPTSTWCIDREPPSLSGLYRKPRPDEVLRYLADVSKFMTVPTIV